MFFFFFFFSHLNFEFNFRLLSVDLCPVFEVKCKMHFLLKGGSNCHCAKDLHYKSNIFNAILCSQS